MSVQDITTLVSTVGFPIVMCGALFWYVTTESKSNREATNALHEQVKGFNETMVEFKKLLSLIYEKVRG